MYHSVASPEDERWIYPEMRLSPARFRAQMEFLARRRRVLSMADLVALIESRRRPPPNAVVITFDDGYLDNATMAAPILAEFSLPAILYLPTAYLDPPTPQWIDRLWRAIQRRTDDRLRLNGSEFDLARPGALARALAITRSALLGLMASERESLIAEVERQLAPEGAAPRLTMNWSEARQLLSSGWELGLHTRRHVDLTAVPEREAATEISGGCADFERHIGHRPRHFSFPYGRASDSLRDLLRRAGFRSAVASGSRREIGCADDPMRLVRVSGHTTPAFLAYWTSRGQRAFQRNGR
jgi:peptidoglycan/xylan/chitin deacetylase (PgdA/CDA1 family)